MAEPKYRHDCDQCEFLGHYAGCDAYWCPAEGGTLVARHSDEPSDNSTMPHRLFADSILENSEIVYHGRQDSERMAFRDLLWSDKCPAHYRAWLMALASWKRGDG